MEKLESILQNICEARKNEAEPVPNGDITIIDGKKSKVDVDKLKGQNEKKTGGVFAIDPPTDDDVIRWDGEPKSKNVKKVLGKIQAEEPFFVLGHAGWGKSTIIKQAAKKERRTVITVYLDKACKEDLGGIPVPIAAGSGRHELQVLMPGWAQYMYDHPEQEFLLFFDEMNQADPEVQNALMPIVLETTICGIRFDNFIVGAAGNFSDENNALHELSGPLRSRFEPIIIWKDNDEESWEDWCKYFESKIKKEYATKLHGRAMEVFDVVRKYAMLFKNPRELETRVFAWMDRIITRYEAQGKSIREEGILDEEEIQDRLTALFVREKDVEHLEDFKKDILDDSMNKKAIKEISEIMWAVLTNAESKTAKAKKDADAGIRFSADQLERIAEMYAKKTMKGKEGSGWVPAQDDKGENVLDKNGRVYRIAASKESMINVMFMTAQQQKQYEQMYKDNAYRFETDADCKKDIPNVLTYDEAMKIPDVAKCLED